MKTHTEIAIECGAHAYGNRDDNYGVRFTKAQLQAFVDAVNAERREAVAEVRCRDGEVFGYISSRVIRDMLPLGTKLFTAPQPPVVP
jgi:hypothetical protein